MPTLTYQVSLQPDETPASLSVVQAIVQGAETMDKQGGLSTLIVNGVRGDNFVASNYAGHRISIPRRRFDLKLGLFLLNHGAISCISLSHSAPHAGDLDLLMAMSQGSPKLIVVRTLGQPCVWFSVKDIQDSGTGDFEHDLGESVAGFDNEEASSDNPFPILGSGTLRETIQHYGWDPDITYANLRLS